jgi:DNA replication protein DnaC
VWCYLESKSEDWKVVKQNIKNIYGFGDKKIKKIFSYLHRANLIKYVQSRCANGDFAQVDIHVQSGFEFDKTQSYIECAHAGAKRVPPINGTTANDELLNKEVTKEREEQDTKNYSATDVAPERDDMTFDEFWKIYPIKKNKVRAKKIWDKEKFRLIVTLICSDVLKRTRSEPQWQDKQYIPHPSTYLGNKLWEDEITQIPPPKKSSGKSSSFDAYQEELKQQMRGTTYEHGAIS